MLLVVMLILCLPHPFLFKHCVFFFSDSKHRPMFLGLRAVASLVVGLTGVLIGLYNDNAAVVEEASPGEFFCPIPPPCPEVEVTGFRAWVFALLLRGDSLLEAVACVGGLCVVYVLYRLFSHGCRSCRKCCCESGSRRQARNAGGRAAVPAGYEALGDLRSGSRVLA